MYDARLEEIACEKKTAFICADIRNSKRKEREWQKRKVNSFRDIIQEAGKS